MTGAIVTIPLIIFLIWIWILWEFKKAPMISLDNKFKTPPGIGKTIKQKKYSERYLALYWRNQIGKTSKHIHSK